MKNTQKKRKGATTRLFVEVPKRLKDVAILVVLGYLTLLFFVTFQNTNPVPFTIVRLLAVLAYVIISSSPLWYPRKDIGLFHPLYLIAGFTFIKSTIPNTRVWSEGVSQHPALPGWTEQSVSLLHVKIIMLQCLSWICILLGYQLSKGVRWRFLQFRDKHRINLVGAIFCFFIGLFCLYQLLALSGGLDAHLKNIARGFAAKRWVGDAQYASVYAALIPMSIALPAILILSLKKPFLNPMTWGTMAVAVVASYLVNGRRSAVVIAVLVFTACWLLRRRSLAIGRLAMIGLVGFAMIGILGEFRRSNWTNRSVDFTVFQELDLELALVNSLEELESRNEAGANFPIVGLVPSKVGFLYGRNYFDYINRFIPRLFWPDKPRGIGIECAEVFYGRYDKGGIPPGALGEAYWSGGVIGVVIIFFCWGMVLKSIGNIFLRFSQSSVACLLYLATIGTLGPSEPQFRAWLYLVGPLVLVLMIFGILKVRFARKN